MHVSAPLLTGAKAFGGEMPRQIEAGAAEFLAALAEEAEAASALLRLVGAGLVCRARAAIRGCRTRDLHAAAAVDIMAAAPIVSPDVALALQPRYRRQERRDPARQVRRARHRDRSHPSLEASASSGSNTWHRCAQEAAPPRRALQRGALGAIRAGKRGPMMTRAPDTLTPPVPKPLSADAARAYGIRRFSDLDDWMREADQDDPPLAGNSRPPRPGQAGCPRSDAA